MENAYVIFSPKKGMHIFLLIPIVAFSSSFGDQKEEGKTE
jgi:hypothetical protein